MVFGSSWTSNQVEPSGLSPSLNVLGVVHYVCRLLCMVGARFFLHVWKDCCVALRCKVERRAGRATLATAGGALCLSDPYQSAGGISYTKIQCRTAVPVLLLLLVSSSPPCRDLAVCAETRVL